MYARELADTVWRGRRFADFLPETVLHDELSVFQDADACSVQESFLLAGVRAVFGTATVACGLGGPSLQLRKASRGVYGNADIIFNALAIRLV